MPSCDGVYKVCWQIVAGLFHPKQIRLSGSRQILVADRPGAKRIVVWNVAILRLSGYKCGPVSYVNCELGAEIVLNVIM